MSKKKRKKKKKQRVAKKREQKRSKRKQRKKQKSEATSSGGDFDGYEADDLDFWRGQPFDDGPLGALADLLQPERYWIEKTGWVRRHRKELFAHAKKHPHRHASQDPGAAARESASSPLDKASSPAGATPDSDSGERFRPAWSNQRDRSNQPTQEVWGVQTLEEEVLKKVSRLLRKGHRQDATEVFDGQWPIDDPATRIARMEALLSVWPARAVQEVCHRHGFIDAKEAKVFAEACLFLDDSQVAQLAAVDSEWGKQAHVVLQASCDVAAGRDEEARTRLRSIGLRSLFRRTRLFLRGLSAYYQRRDEESRKIFSRLAQSSAFGEVCRVLLWMIAEQAEQQEAAGNDDVEGRDTAETEKKTRRLHEDENVERRERGKSPLALWQRRIVDLWGVHALLERATIREAVEHLRAQQLNRAMRTLSLCTFTPNGPFLFALNRDLPLTAASFGVDMTRVASNLLKCGLGLPWDPFMNATGALMMEHKNKLPYANKLWEDYHQDSATLDLAPPGWTDKYQAMIRDRMANNLIQLIVCSKRTPMGFLEMDRFCEIFDSSPIETLFSYTEDSLELDPEEIDHWRTHLKILDLTEDRKKKGKTLERMLDIFPSNPDVLIAAAEEALHRKAVEKALRFATRAAELEPLATHHRVLRCRILLTKARKRIAQRKFDEARQLYAEIIRVARPRASDIDEVWLTAQTELAVLEEALEGPEGLYENRRRFLRIRNLSWLWTLYVLEGRKRLYSGKTGRVLASHQGNPFVKHVSHKVLRELISTEIQTEELEKFLRHRPEEVKKSGTYRYYTQSRFLISAGIMQGRRHIKSRRLLKEVFEDYVDPVSQFAIVDHASDIFPEDPYFCFHKYSLAKRLKKEPAYFQNAARQLKAAEQKLYFIIQYWNGIESREHEVGEDEPWMSLWDEWKAQDLAYWMLSEIPNLQRFASWQLQTHKKKTKKRCEQPNFGFEKKEQKAFEFFSEREKGHK